MHARNAKWTENHPRTECPTRNNGTTGPPETFNNIPHAEENVETKLYCNITRYQVCNNKRIRETDASVKRRSMRKTEGKENGRLVVPVWRCTLYGINAVGVYRILVAYRCKERTKHKCYLLYTVVPYVLLDNYKGFTRNVTLLILLYAYNIIQYLLLDNRF